VYLVCRDRRSPEQRQSDVGEHALLRRSGRPIFSLHYTVVCCGTPERNTIFLIVRAHPVNVLQRPTRPLKW
jgi:hypothetical protein